MGSIEPMKPLRSLRFQQSTVFVVVCHQGQQGIWSELLQRISQELPFMSSEIRRCLIDNVEGEK